MDKIEDLKKIKTGIRIVVCLLQNFSFLQIVPHTVLFKGGALSSFFGILPS